MTRILGAGLSGLSCAVNLALAGRDVTVIERNSSSGMQIHENYQVLQTRKSGVEEYLGLLNLKPKFHYFRLDKALFSTSSRDLDIKVRPKVNFVQRGGEE
ncbi:MAG: FAD-dependent oxidoreductase, partial [Candidatus Altiarchaeota archaeon]|nr:FAD-dependent oxidoreductase [Candidatus Altiarchaeota archaeon]